MIAKIYPKGDLDPVSGFVSGTQYTAQKIRQVLLLIRGEWFLDLNLGTPWFEEILVRNPNLELIRGIVKNKILSVPGVMAVPVLSLNLDRPTRTLSIDFVAKTTAGSIDQTVEVTI